MVVATAVNGEGKREIIGMDVGTSEDGAFWQAFLRSLSARGLSGVELVVSDAHQGLRGAIAAVFGGASWQRCRTHFMTNLLTRVPRRVQPWISAICQQPSPDYTPNSTRVTDQLGDRSGGLSTGRGWTRYPGLLQGSWSNNPLERLNGDQALVGRPAVRRTARRMGRRPPIPHTRHSDPKRSRPISRRRQPS